MIIMLIVQFGLWFNARQAALAAAQAGAQVAREDAAMTANWQGLAQQASSDYFDSLNTRLLGSLKADRAAATRPTRSTSPVQGRWATRCSTSST